MPCVVFAGLTTPLERTLSGYIEESSDSHSNTISYCPDNTCEAFSAPQRTPYYILHDFTFMYLYEVSDYVYLRDLKDKPPKVLTDIIEYSRGECQAGDVLCILRDLQKKYEISAEFVRYDKGVRAVVPIDLPDVLKNDAQPLSAPRPSRVKNSVNVKEPSFRSLTSD